jgi:hypothetical protein
MPSVQERLSGLEALAAVKAAIDTRQLAACQSMQLTGLAWSCPGKSGSRWSAHPVVSIIEVGSRYDICLRNYASESCTGNLWLSICSAVNSGNGCKYTDPAGAPAAKRAVDGILVLALNRKAVPPQQDAAFQAAAKAALDAPNVDTNLAAAAEARRRLQIQVDALLASQRPIEAARAYSAYLATDPLWAEGHYNFAIVLAGLELYPDAIGAAQKCAYLAPDGADARNAKDQIYKWEALLAAPAG